MFSELADALQAYRSLDPEAWLRLYRVFPIGVGIVLVALGVVMLLFGGGRFFRFVAGPMGAWAGYVCVPVVLAEFGIRHDAAVVTLAAALLGVGGVLFPPLAVFFAFGLPAGLMLGNAVGRSDWPLGFLPGFIATGTLAAAMHRFIGAIASSVVGAWLLVIGLLSALHQVGGLVNAMISQPWGVVVAALLFAISGSVYQLAVRPSPEEKEKLDAERARAERQRREKQELEKRWSNYTANRNK